MIPQAVDPRIVRFIGKHHVMTLATTVGDLPHCCQLFYAYSSEQNYLVVTSSENTFHAQQLANNSVVAGSIVLESRVIGNLQGVQLRATMTRPDADQTAKAKQIYLRKFPFAAVMELDLWIIHPTQFKMTDNRLGFGKKLLWPTEIE